MTGDISDIVKSFNEVIVLDDGTVLSQINWVWQMDISDDVS